MEDIKQSAASSWNHTYNESVGGIYRDDEKGMHYVCKQQDLPPDIGAALVVYSKDGQRIRIYF